VRRVLSAVSKVVPLPERGVEDQVAFVGGGEEDAFEEGDGFLRGMLAVTLFPFFGWLDFPDGFHLFAAIGFLHQFVIEGVAGFFVARGPDDGFGGVSEIAAGEIGRRIGLDPGNVVEEFEAKLLHGEADRMDDVSGAGNPEGAVGLEDTLAGSEPGAIKFVIGVGTFGLVPFAFVDADHAAGVTGDAAVGEEVGRVGEDEVDGRFGDEGEEFEAIALVEADVVFGVVEDRGRSLMGDLVICQRSISIVNQVGTGVKEWKRSQLTVFGEEKAVAQSGMAVPREFSKRLMAGKTRWVRFDMNRPC
jgi:hypothetical protein